jgi:hypothetical protein
VIIRDNGKKGKENDGPNVVVCEEQKFSQVTKTNSDCKNITSKVDKPFKKNSTI